MDLKIKTEIIGDKYLIKVINFENECEYHFNIHKDGKYITTIFSKEGIAEYKLIEDGLYYCRIAVFKNGEKIKTEISKVREYFTGKSKKQLKNIVSRTKATKKLLQLTPSKPPFCDICLVMKKIGGGILSIVLIQMVKFLALEMDIRYIFLEL